MPEALIIEALRTPMGRYRGALSRVRPDDLAARVIREAVARSGADPGGIADVYFGAANQAGEDNRDLARMAALLAGLPGVGQGVATVVENVDAPA
jgi:acetyl-CoA acetyltransferase